MEYFSCIPYVKTETCQLTILSIRYLIPNNSLLVIWISRWLRSQRAVSSNLTVDKNFSF